MNRYRRLSLTLLVTGLLVMPAANAVEEASATDVWNHVKLEMSYLLDLELNPYDIVVEVRDGTAYLSGTLPTAEEKARAERLALQVEGIDQVENDIVLDEDIPQNQVRYENPKEAASDANIEAMIKAQLSWHRVTEGEPISVSVQDGTATLTGTVSNEEVKREASRVAENTRWVNQVVDNLDLNN